MSDIDKDLQRRLRGFADQISPEPGQAQAVVRRARGKRRLVALSAGLAVLVAVGGLAGAATLLGGRDGIKPAPAPAPEKVACADPTYDIAVFLEDETTQEELAALRGELESHDDVASIRFVTAGQAYEEFKEYYADQPEFWENLPEDALPSSLRVNLVEGADAKDALGRFRSLEHVDAVREASEIAKDRPDAACSPESGRTFARYFFESDQGNASASGRLTVRAEDPSLCLDVQTREITASHLLWMDPDRPDDRGTVVLTFFDPNDGENGPNLPPTGTHCFTGEQLDDLIDDALFALLVERPSEFRIDFHRGPDDEPGLVAELMTADEAFGGTTYVDEEDRVSVHVPNGWHVAEESLTPGLVDPREILSLGTAPMPVGGERCDHQPESALESMGPADAFVSIQERHEPADYPARPESFEQAAEATQNKFDACAELEDIDTFWLPFSDEGRNFYLLAAVGKSAPGRVDELWEVVESLDFSPETSGVRATATEM